MTNTNKPVKPTVHVLRYEEKFHHQTIEILGYIWKRFSYEERDSLFTWRYLENPYLNEHFVIIAMTGDRVIGIAPYVVLKYYFGNEVRFVLSAADTVIHPDFQGLGAYGKMADFAMDYVKENCKRLNFGVYLNLSSNDLSTPMCLKLGWEKLLPRNYLYKVNLISLLKVKLGMTPNQTPVQKRQARIEVDVEPRIKEMIGVNDSIKSPIRSVRDEDYYQWHYKHGSYLFVYVYENDSLAAYLVLQKHSNLQSQVLEWVASTKSAMRKAFQFASSNLCLPVIRMYYVHLNSEEMTVLKSSWFIAEPLLLQRVTRRRRHPALVRPVDLSMNREQRLIDGLDPLCPEHWSLMRIDAY